MSLLQRLHEVDADVLADFIRKRKSTALPEDLQQYAVHLNAVPAIVHKMGANMMRVVKALQAQFPELNFSTARQRYYDAMNFFHIDDTVSTAAWDNYYADQLDKLALLCIAADKHDTAKRCYDKAHQLRTAASERVEIGTWKPPVFIISNRIRPEDLGYAKKSILDIARKAEDGFYINLINALPTTEKEKKRLLKDAGIQDVPFEETPNDDSDNAT